MVYDANNAIFPIKRIRKGKRRKKVKSRGGCDQVARERTERQDRQATDAKFATGMNDDIGRDEMHETRANAALQIHQTTTIATFDLLISYEVSLSFTHVLSHFFPSHGNSLAAPKETE
ncbi:hypothetical protein TWF694_009773 [Orbilia ellipsospora]|uniref:Uncharacterized protein n=1 Tax=Orbilia ellipsospora TaxID=2528407 RepID=A0AAV9XD69_9PEZI